jgi:hypothetical protein
VNKKDDTFFVTPPLFIQRIIFTHFGKAGLKKDLKEFMKIIQRIVSRKAA